MTAATDPRDDERLMSEADEREADWNDDVLGIPRGPGDPDTYGYPGEGDDDELLEGAAIVYVCPVPKCEFTDISPGKCPEHHVRLKEDAL